MTLGRVGGPLSGCYLLPGPYARPTLTPYEPVVDRVAGCFSFPALILQAVHFYGSEPATRLSLLGFLPCHIIPCFATLRDCDLFSSFVVILCTPYTARKCLSSVRSIPFFFEIYDHAFERFPRTVVSCRRSCTARQGPRADNRSFPAA